MYIINNAHFDQTSPDLLVINPEGHQNPIRGAKVTAVLLKGWILAIGGVASGRVCACSLQPAAGLFYMFIVDIKLNLPMRPEQDHSVGP